MSWHICCRKRIIYLPCIPPHIQGHLDVISRDKNHTFHKNMRQLDRFICLQDFKIEQRSLRWRLQNMFCYHLSFLLWRIMLQLINAILILKDSCWDEYKSYICVLKSKLGVDLRAIIGLFVIVILESSSKNLLLCV